MADAMHVTTKNCMTECITVAYRLTVVSIQLKGWRTERAQFGGCVHCCLYHHQCLQMGFKPAFNCKLSAVSRSMCSPPGVRSVDYDNRQVLQG